MGWRGAALGGVVGLAVGGPIGGLLGATLGSGVEGVARRFDLIHDQEPTNRQRIQEGFFEATFSVMGHIAKADGRVSETEIAFAESVMDRMGLSPALRRAAIMLFNQGKSSEFDLKTALGEIRSAGLDRGFLKRIFLEVEVAAAYVDGPPAPAQAKVLERIRQTLGVPMGTFHRIEQLILIQQRILHGMYGSAGGHRGGHAGGARPTREPPVSALNQAFATLGLTSDASDAEVKRAYRKLMSQHHPDKLASRGLPEEAMKLASQRTQEIRRAYETITESRAT